MLSGDKKASMMSSKKKKVGCSSSTAYEKQLRWHFFLKRGTRYVTLLYCFPSHIICTLLCNPLFYTPCIYLLTFAEVAKKWEISCYTQNFHISTWNSTAAAVTTGWRVWWYGKEAEEVVVDKIKYDISSVWLRFSESFRFSFAC